MPDLNVQRRRKRRDLHFYMSEEHVVAFDRICEEKNAARGKVMEALIDYYLETRTRETQ